MIAESPQYDVVTLGEGLLRLTPPALRRIEQASSLEIEVGGSEANTAVGLSRLGLRVAWLSRLTANPLGQLIKNTLAGYGVDTSWLVWTNAERVGLYFVEEGKAPRGSQVIYDRAGSAFSHMQPTELPAQLFRPDGAKLLHLSGITPALGEDAAATARRSLDLAREAGWKISFDLNYRSSLWSPRQAVQICDYFAARTDLLLVPISDVRLLYELSTDTNPQAVLTYLTERYPAATVVLTLGKAGAIGLAPGGEMMLQPVFEAEEVGRIGGGDAFAAGLIYGYLLGWQTSPSPSPTTPTWLKAALGWGAAVAAYKYTIPGDLALIDRQAVEALLAQTKPAQEQKLKR